jgi:hypothetical protein
MFYRHNYNYGKVTLLEMFFEIEPFLNFKFKSVYGVVGFGYGRSMNPTNHLGVLYNDAVNGAQNSYFGANTTWTNTLSYDKKLEIIKLVNWELLQNQVNNYVSGSRNNLLFGEDPKYAFTNNTSAVTINDVSVNGADWAAGGGGIQSFFARAQYDYKEKYLLAATMRVDGSSILLQKIDGVFHHYPRAG